VRDIESGSRETHIYLNPSSSEGPLDANVFLYMGGDNDPSQDVAMHHYMTDPRRKDVPS
jgi:hypothetical protein